MRKKISCSIVVVVFIGFVISCSHERQVVAASEHSAINAWLVPDSIDFIFHVKPILSDRCFVCHGPDENTREAGLALHDPDSAYALLTDPTAHYAIVPHHPEHSTIISRIYNDDPNDMMPPPESNLKLEPYEKEILYKWIEQGAEYQEHWAFIPPSKPTVPQIDQALTRYNEIDHFVFDQLHRNGIVPSEAERDEKLLRRVSFALTGLPPEVSMVRAYKDSSDPKKYEHFVDELLQSESYAERMTQIWMDLSRYADSHGYQDDPQRFQWPWRDWVIHAYNKNLPFDQFVTWQIAGDLLPDASLEQIIATGFNRNHKITFEGGVIPEEFRVEYVADRAQTFGTAFLGLTVECARCHDHKYDPISQKNYFELFSFFNNVPEKGLTEPVGMTPIPYIVLTKDDVLETLQFINTLDSFKSVNLMVMQEMAIPRQAHILARGQYDQPTIPVMPSAPEAILSYDGYESNRLGLSKWLFDKDNPLTARVAVNRLWQQIFGEGLVSSSFDFGNQGALPTHPKLLDYLALKYQNEGWNTKEMLKYMVMSATFRQSSKNRVDLQELDPENRLLARSNRIRLDAEMIRDQALAVAELLNPTVGGESVKPYQPSGLWEETIGGGGDLRTYVQDEGDKLYRRSLYTFWKRTVPPPSMMTFDAASKDLCTIKRQETNTPLQALVLMNDPQIVEASRILAQNAIRDGGKNPEQRIAFMFEKSTTRNPSTEELKILYDLYQAQIKTFGQAQTDAEAYLSVGELRMQSDMTPSELAAYAMVASTIFNLDEAMSRG